MKKFLPYLFAGILAFTGCAGNISSRLPRENCEPCAKKNLLYSEIGVRGNLNFPDYDIDLGEKIQTTDPIDPCPTKTLTTNLNKGHGDNFSLGLEGLLGLKGLLRTEIGLKIGADIRYNSPGGYRDGIYDVKKVPIGPPYESYVFTQLIPSTFTYTPFIGIEAAYLISKNKKPTLDNLFRIHKLKLGFEMGRPQMGFKVRSGNDWYGSWRTDQKDSWKGHGKRITGTIGYEEETCERDHYEQTPYKWYKASISFYMSKEEYKPEFAGEKAKIDIIEAGLLYKYTF